MAGPKYVFLTPLGLISHTTMSPGMTGGEFAPKTYAIYDAFFWVSSGSPKNLKYFDGTGEMNFTCDSANVCRPPPFTTVPGTVVLNEEGGVASWVQPTGVLTFAKFGQRYLLVARSKELEWYERDLTSGRLLRMTNPRNESWEMTYDSLSRLTRVDLMVRIENQPLQPVSATFTYDSAGRLMQYRFTTVDGEGWESFGYSPTTGALTSVTTSGDRHFAFPP